MELTILQIFPQLTEGRVRLCGVNKSHRILSDTPYSVAELSSHELKPICDECRTEYLIDRYELKSKRKLKLMSREEFYS